MFRLSLVCIGVALGSAAAGAEPRQACTLAAAEKLPRIAGLEIVSTNVVDLEKPAGWIGDAPPMRVELEFKAAGQNAWSVWICAIGKDGRPLLAEMRLPPKS